jgi:hypothetical protein
MNTPPICNGCGNESPAWDKLCNNCSQQEVDLCASCVQEVFAKQDEDEEEYFRSQKSVRPTDVDDPHEEYGFDHQWELYDR